MRTCVYPGSFDPFTNGHMDIVRRASTLFDSVIVSILCNSLKSPFFTLEERLSFIRAAVASAGLDNVRCDSFDGLLVDHVRNTGSRFIIRGLRAVPDFEYELQMAGLNRMLAPDIETVFLMTSMQYACISASVVKEIGQSGGDISNLVPASNVNKIMERLRKP